MLNLICSPLMRYPTPRNSGLPFLGLNFIPFFLVAFLAFSLRNFQRLQNDFPRCAAAPSCSPTQILSELKIPEPRTTHLAKLDSLGSLTLTPASVDHVSLLSLPLSLATSVWAT